MRKTIVALSLSTLLFAALSAYLAWQLRDRESIVASPLAASCPAAPISHSLSSATEVPKPSVAPGEMPAANGTPVCDATRAELDRANAEAQAKYMAQLRIDLADPAKRAAMIDQARRSVIANEPRLASYMGMKDAEFAAFVSLLAEQSLLSTEHFARCSPKCAAVDGKKLNDRRAEAALEFLGEEGNERYARYEQTRTERREVDNFRATLPDKQAMTDDQYELLITALSDERQKFERETAARGLNVAGSGGMLGMLYWDDSQHSVAERVAAARKYSERLRSRASAVLTADQMHRYSEAQESALANLENFLPWQDTLDASGLARGRPTR